MLNKSGSEVYQVEEGENVHPMDGQIDKRDRSSGTREKCPADNTQVLNDKRGESGVISRRKVQFSDPSNPRSSINGR
jgi:hypothetical protein